MHPPSIGREKAYAGQHRFGKNNHAHTSRGVDDNKYGVPRKRTVRVIRDKMLSHAGWEREEGINQHTRPFPLSAQETSAELRLGAFLRSNQQKGSTW